MFDESRQLTSCNGACSESRNDVHGFPWICTFSHEKRKSHDCPVPNSDLEERLGNVHTHKYGTRSAIKGDCIQNSAFWVDTVRSIVSTVM